MPDTCLRLRGVSSALSFSESYGKHLNFSQVWCRKQIMRLIPALTFSWMLSAERRPLGSLERFFVSGSRFHRGIITANVLEESNESESHCGAAQFLPPSRGVWGREDMRFRRGGDRLLRIGRIRKGERSRTRDSAQRRHHNDRCDDRVSHVFCDGRERRVRFFDRIL